MKLVLLKRSNCYYSNSNVFLIVDVCKIEFLV